MCWLIQGLSTVGKKTIGFLGHFCFFKCHCLLPVCRVNSCLNGKHGFTGFWASHSKAYEPTPLFSVWVSQHSPGVQVHQNPVLVGYWEGCMWMGQQGVADTHLTWISSVGVTAPLSHWTSLINHKCKGKFINNLKMAIAEHLNQVVCPSEHRTLCDCTCPTLMEAALPNTYSRYLIYVLNE